MIHLALKQLMIPTLSRQEHHFAFSDFAGEHFNGGCVERRIHTYLFPPGQAFNLIQTAVADDANAFWNPLMEDLHWFLLFKLFPSLFRTAPAF